jgi:hypothetical protein
MKALAGVAVAVVVVVQAAPADAAGGYRPPTHQEMATQLPRHGQVQPPRHGQPAAQGIAPQATNPGMPSFHQPSYSIDRKEWWQPHPYFPQNAQSPGYPSRPARPYAGYWNERR